jgi:peptide/nickel transport system substrate-binding protein
MKLRHRSSHPSGRIVLAILAILFVLSAGPAKAAPEPGTITVVLVVEPLNLEPVDSARDSVNYILLKNVGETLVVRNIADSSISPRLATSWKQIDPTTWRFSLRKGVKFHDGADFNAEAVIYNIKRLFDKKLPSLTRDKYFAGVSMEGKALDSHTVEIKLDKPNPVLLPSLSWLVMCSPNTPPEKPTRTPIGTGPYKFVKWDAGTQIVLERFDGYWGKQPQAKKAVFLWRNESSVRAAMVLIGEADVTPTISLEDANHPDMDQSYLDSETSYVRIGSDIQDPLINDRRVRMAMNYAIDRNAIKGSILSKDVIPATQLYVPGTFGHDPNMKVWPYDPQKAKQLIDEARKDGVPVDKEIQLVARIAHFPGSTELAEALTNMYRAVGLNVKMKAYEYGVYNKMRAIPSPPNIGPFVVLQKHDNSSGDVVVTMLGAFHCKSSTRGMCDKATDELIEKAQVATGEERRTLWYAAAKRIYQEIVPVAPLFHMVAYARVAKRITFKKPTMAMVYEIPLEDITFKQ